MRRLLGLILMLTVLLCGCTQQNPDGTTPTDESTQPSTQPATQPTTESVPQPTQSESGLYQPDSLLEQTTSGSVQSFSTGDGCYGAFVIGNGETILLRNDNGRGVLEQYVENQLIPKKKVSLGEGVLPLPEDFCVTGKGVAYYDGVDNAMVFLSQDLREIGRMRLPEDISGNAWISPDWKTLYYCKADGFYAMDLQTGISRLLREHPALRNQITGLLGDGSALRCTEDQEDGSIHTILIDAATGEVLAEGSYLDSLLEWENHYFYQRYDGAILRLHFGTGREPSEVLWPLEEGEIYPVLPDAALVVATPRSDGITLTYYRMNAGSRYAAIDLPGVTEIRNVYSDGQGGICFFAEDVDNGMTLCRWNPAKSTVQDENCYKSPCYTEQEPDRNRLPRFVRAAKALGERYGVEILIWNQALKFAPSDHVFEAEYLTQAYEQCLPELEQALAFFPEGFFENMPGV